MGTITPQTAKEKTFLKFWVSPLKQQEKNSRQLGVATYVSIFVLLILLVCLIVGTDVLQLADWAGISANENQMYWDEEILSQDNSFLIENERKPALEIVGDRCRMSRRKLDREAQKPHGNLRGEKRFWFNNTWHNIIDLYGSMEILRKTTARTSIVCVISSIKGEVPCLQHECLIPLYIRPHYSDFSVVKQLIENREYAFIKNYLPTTILDGGANVGYASVLLGQMFPSALIISVEASAENYKILKLNTRHFRNVIPINAGIFNKIANMKLVNGSENTREGWQYMLKKSEDVPLNEGVPLKTVTVDFLLQLFGMKQLDFVKIDIEGSEKEVFTTSMNYNPYVWLNVTKLLAVEIHDRMKKGCSLAVNSTLKRGNQFVSLRSGEYVIWHNRRSVDQIMINKGRSHGIPSIPKNESAR